MKKIIPIICVIALGVCLLLLREPIAGRTDKLIFKEQFSFSKFTVLFNSEQMAKAEKEMKTLVLKEKVSPKSRAMAFYNLGELALLKAFNGDSAAVQDAVFYYKEALRANPTLWQAKYNLELLYRSGADPKDGQRPGRGRPQNEKGEQEENDKDRKNGPTIRMPYLGDRP